MDREGKPRDGDWAVFVAGGRGVGQWRLLRSDSAGVNLRVRRPWRIEPDGTSTVIVQRVFRNNIARAPPRWPTTAGCGSMRLASD